MLDEAKPGLSPLPRPIYQQRMRFIDKGVGGHELPRFAMSLREKRRGTGMKGIFRDEMREEAAGVNENALQRSTAYTCAKCRYLSVETSVNSE